MKIINSILGIVMLTIFSTAFSGPALINSEASSTNYNSINNSTTINIKQANKTVSGEKLYQENCARCHGEDRKGISPTYPSLLNVNEKLDKSEAKTIVKEGKGQMPSMSYLSEKEVDAIVTWVFEEAEE